MQSIEESVAEQRHTKTHITGPLIFYVIMLAFGNQIEETSQKL